MRWPTALEGLAALSGALAVAAWAVWHWAGDLPETTFLRDWMPNAGTDLVFVVVTLPIIEGAERFGDRNRNRPRLEPVMDAIGEGLQTLVGEIAVDYVLTFGSDAEAVPDGLVENLDLWLKDPWAGGKERSRAYDGEPLVMAEAERFGEVLHRLRDNDTDVLNWHDPSSSP